MDVVLYKLSCNSSLPLSIVGETFQSTCNGGKRCSLEGDTALMEGQFVLNGIQDVGMENGKVYFSAYIDTASSTFVINEVSSNLCNHAVEENLYGANNGDDAYNWDDANNADNGDDANNGNGVDAYNGNGDDANNGNGNDNNQCELQDGTYNFSTKIRIPQFESIWGDTGWAATGQVNMYTYGGTQIGSCEASFRTLSADGPSSKTVFLVLVPMAGMIFFLLIYVGVRKAIRNNRDLCGDDLTCADDLTCGDDSTYKTTGGTTTAMSADSDYTSGSDTNSSKKNRETDTNSSRVSREIDTNTSRKIWETNTDSARKTLDNDSVSSWKTTETDISIKQSRTERSERSEKARDKGSVIRTRKSGESDCSESGTSGIQEAIILGNHKDNISKYDQRSKAPSIITQKTVSMAVKAPRRPSRQKRCTSGDDAMAYQRMEEATGKSVTAEEATAYHRISEDNVNFVDMQNEHAIAPRKHEKAEKFRRVSKDLAEVGGDLAARGGDMMSTFASAFSGLASNQDIDNKDAALFGHSGERVTSHHHYSRKKGKHVLEDDNSSVQAVALERQGLSGCSDDTTVNPSDNLPSIGSM